MHYIVCLGVPQGVLILVSRSLLCSGSCPFPPQKTHFLVSSHLFLLMDTPGRRPNKNI